MNDDQKTRPTARLSSQQADVLLSFLSAGVAQEVPLDEVFCALAEDVMDPGLRDVALHLSRQLEQGADLETAVSSISSLLPAHLKRALVMGAKSGNLSAILAGLAESAVACKQIHRGLRSALSYPLLVVALLVLLVVFISLYVAPSFQKIYQDFGLQPSYVTQRMLSLADAAPVTLWALAAVGGVALALAFHSTGRRYLHRLRKALPIVGRVWDWTGQHEFATLMATLTRQQIPVTDALACTVESLRDRAVAGAAQVASLRCENGLPLSESLRESIHFDRTLTSLLEWGEAHQGVPDALQEAAHIYEQQMQHYVQFLNRTTPPLMLMLVATTLFLLVASLMAPLVDLIDALSY